MHRHIGIRTMSHTRPEGKCVTGPWILLWYPLSDPKAYLRGLYMLLSYHALEVWARPSCSTTCDVGSGPLSLLPPPVLQSCSWGSPGLVTKVKGGGVTLSRWAKLSRLVETASIFHKSCSIWGSSHTGVWVPGSSSPHVGISLRETRLQQPTDAT